MNILLKLEEAHISTFIICPKNIKTYTIIDSKVFIKILQNLDQNLKVLG